MKLNTEFSSYRPLLGCCVQLSLLQNVSYKNNKTRKRQTTSVSHDKVSFLKLETEPVFFFFCSHDVGHSEQVHPLECLRMQICTVQIYANRRTLIKPGKKSLFIKLKLKTKEIQEEVHILE